MPGVTETRFARGGDALECRQLRIVSPDPGQLSMVFVELAASPECARDSEMRDIVTVLPGPAR